VLLVRLLLLGLLLHLAPGLLRLEARLRLLPPSLALNLNLGRVVLLLPLAWSLLESLVLLPSSKPAPPKSMFGCLERVHVRNFGSHFSSVVFSNS
jgi:hypothetical protein